MQPLFYIILSTGIISLVSFVGILVLIFREKFLEKILLILVAFSAGALIGGSFFHLLPEAVNQSPGNTLNIFIFAVVGFCLFFILEQFILWHHCHHLKHDKECTSKPFSYLILLSDGLHNFIDGLVIAAAFLLNFSTGLAASIAIIIHEIPQEIGDFGVMIYGGFDKKKALMLNFSVALIAVLGGILGYVFMKEFSMFYLLAFASGNFLYIAASDLIPEIKHKEKLGTSMLYFLFFILGIIVMYLMKILII